MPQNYQLTESMLFDYETTYRTAYKGGRLPILVKTGYKEKPVPARAPAPPARDTHTLTAWKNCIPFDMLHKPKDVVKTNPYIPQRCYERPRDMDREKVQNTRPRLVMTPAVSMDDIDDARARDILCRDMYTSDVMRALRETATITPTVQAPLPDHPAPANPIVLPKLLPARVPAEWRMDSVTWEAKQLRGFCDPTRDFWLNQKLPKCRACNESAAIDSHRKMNRQMKH